MSSATRFVCTACCSCLDLFTTAKLEQMPLPCARPFSYASHSLVGILGVDGGKEGGLEDANGQEHVQTAEYGGMQEKTESCGCPGIFKHRYAADCQTVCQACMHRWQHILSGLAEETRYT